MYLPLSIFLILATLFAFPLRAQTNEASPSSAAESIRNAVKEKVMERIQNVVNRKIGIVGTITDITEINLKVQSEGAELTVTTAADTQYQRTPGKRSIAREDLEVNSPVIVLGYQESNSSTINAGLIQLIPTPTTPKRQTLHGTIESLTSTSLTLTTSDQQTWTIALSKSTDYLQKAGTKITIIKSTTLEESDTIIVGGIPDDKTDFTLNATFALKLPATP